MAISYDGFCRDTKEMYNFEATCLCWMFPSVYRLVTFSCWVFLHVFCEPFMYLFQNDPRLAENFDKHFTSNPLELTPTDLKFLRNMQGDEFSGFSFVNLQYDTVIVELPDLKTMSIRKGSGFNDVVTQF